MSKYYKLSDDTIDTFNEILKKKLLSTCINFEFIGCETQKCLIKINKIPENYLFIIGKELLVSINEDVMLNFDNESIEILIEQEIDKISINMDSGKIKMIKPDLTTFSGLVEKWGLDKISRALQIEILSIDKNIEI